MQIPPNYAPTRNVALLMELVTRVQDRSAGLPGMGCFYGPTGWGKSQAVCCAAITHRAYYVQVKSLWSRKYLLEQILLQMAIKPERTMPYMLEQAGRQLAQSNRPLIVDEADILVTRGMAEVLRDIYESSQGTVILVGEENLPRNLEKIERIHGRMLDWTAAQPTDLADARLFAKLHCAGLNVSDCLLESVIAASKGAARYVCTNLHRVAEWAALNGAGTVTAADYTGALFTGALPARGAK